MTEPDNRGKRPVSAALAGPYGHPFHPMLVTVPIGAWVSSVVLDIGSHVGGSGGELATGARWLVAIGVVSALAAATVGLLDFFAIPTGTPAHRTALVHMCLNLTITVGFAGGFVWRLGDTGPTAAGPLVLSLVLLGALGVSGALGGKLAYHYGVRVASEAVQAEGFSTGSGHPVASASAHPVPGRGE